MVKGFSHENKFCKIVVDHKSHLNEFMARNSFGFFAIEDM